MEKLSSAAIVPQFLRDVIVFANESRHQFSGKSKILEKLCLFLISCFLFFLRSLHSVVIPFLNPNSKKGFSSGKDFKKFPLVKLEIDDCVPYSGSGGGGDSGIGRAIWQLLSAMNEIPVSSRKYEVVRSLAEKLIEENHNENSIALSDLNHRVLTASFRRTLGLLEAAVERNRRNTGEPVRYGLNRLVRAAARTVGDGLTGWSVEEADQSAETADKLAAEVLWLTEKMADYGFVDEAVEKWASACNLARLALWCEPRLQCSFVQISALLFKEANLNKIKSSMEDKWKQIKKQMLISWLPLLCRATNGPDKPVLRTAERSELEKVLEKMISELKEEEQEQVLSIWLHHYTHCSSADWPNLHGSYTRWCHSSRKLLVFNSDKN